MAESKGQQRDVFGAIAIAIVALATGLIMFAGNSHEKTETRFVGRAGGGHTERPALPTVMRPSGN